MCSLHTFQTYIFGTLFMDAPFTVYSFYIGMTKKELPFYRQSLLTYYNQMQFGSSIEKPLALQFLIACSDQNVGIEILLIPTVPYRFKRRASLKGALPYRDECFRKG